MKINAVDLFCGVGGLTHGLVRAGVNVVAGVDIDEDCRFAYEANNPGNFFSTSVADLTANEIKKWLGNDRDSLTLLAGCAPCQPFSTYSKGARRPGWTLLDSFSRLINELKPELVTMENVPGLAKKPVYKRFIESLKDNKYQITELTNLDCREFGIPQSRKRLVILASRLGKVAAPTATHSRDNFVTVRDTIQHLPRIAAGATTIKKDRLHISAGLSELNLRRIRSSTPGGSWKDWPKDLRATCHKKDSGSTFPSVYGRMEWDKPAPTITTQAHGYGNGRFGHPSQARAISLREAAMLQTFPEKYKFVDAEESVSFTKLGRLIGNAVPVALGEVIGTSLLRHVREVKSSA